MTSFQSFLINIACLFYPVKFYGLENIPEGKTVIVCNHFSFVDPIFLKKAYKKELCILAKNQLFKNKLVGSVLKAYGAIPINREAPDMSSIFAVTKALKDNKKVAIFPEGTRNKKGEGEPLKLKGGSVVFAIRTKSPIIPCAMVKKPRIFKRTELIFGKPFYLEEFYDKKLTEEEILKTDEVVREKIIELQKELTLLKQNKKKKRKNK